MRHLRKVMTLVVAALMALVVATPAWADGTNGKVTVENATVGVTYRAYKVFDATYDGNKIAYTADATLFAALGGVEGTNLSAGPFSISGTADKNGNYAVTLTDSSADAETIGAWIEEHLDKFTEVPATAGLDENNKATVDTVVFGNLAYGYYYVTSGLGSVVTIDSAKPEVTVKDKNPQTPDGPDKVITGEDAVIVDSDQSFDPGVSENDAAVGSKQSFEISYNATNWVTTGSGSNVESKQVEKFYIEDVPANMTIDPNTINVKVGAIDVITNGAVVDNTNYPATVSVAAGDAGKLSITIDWINSAGDSIYSAADGEANIEVTLTYDATVLPGAATANANNTVTVKYDRTDETGVVLNTDSTETDTYHFKLTKTDGKTDEGLKGAKFELTLGSTKVSFIDVNDNGSLYRVAGVGETGTTTIDMKGNTEIEIQGLDKKDYSLTEIEAPKGYNLLTAPVNVVADNLKKATEDAAEYTVDVDNNQGSVLPSTGGMGTTILYIVGGIMVAGAAIYLLTKKRASNM